MIRSVEIGFSIRFGGGELRCALQTGSKAAGRF